MHDKGEESTGAQWKSPIARSWGRPGLDGESWGCKHPNKAMSTTTVNLWEFQFHPMFHATFNILSFQDFGLHLKDVLPRVRNIDTLADTRPSCKIRAVERDNEALLILSEQE